MTDAELYEMLEDIDNTAQNLTKWEIGFVEDLLEKHPSLSQKQAGVIEDLYARYVHPGTRFRS